MGVESFTNVQSLNENWPLGTDPRSEGDDHIRGIKKVLKATDGGALTLIKVTGASTSGTYTKPAGLKFLEVICVGGGGGAKDVNGTGAGQSAASAGGGGAGTVIRVIAAASLGATQAYTVGAAGSNTTSGGSTTFAGLTAAGGVLGLNTAPSASPSAALGGAGGAVSGTIAGDIGIAGGRGESGVAAWMGNASLAYAGGGGGSFLSPPTFGFVTTAAAGTAAPNVGGGASGGANGASQGARGGAQGGSGAIYFKEYS